jgi:hypothetical protein
MKMSPCLAGPALRDAPVAELVKQFDLVSSCSLGNLALSNAGYPI